MFNYDKYPLKPEVLKQLYVSLMEPRMIEEKMLVLLRQGKISKWFSGIGQEAISVGCASALMNDEYILTMHRNLGVFTTRSVPYERLFAQWQGKQSGFTNGRDRSFHFGTKEFNIVGMISHLGPQLSVADGIALGQKLRGLNKATLVFTGDGGASEGEFHEALNVAAVWNLPVVFVVENNGYGLSTPTNQQVKNDDFTAKAKGYGIEAYTVEGNNILDVFVKTSQVVESIRENPRPILLDCKTFRVRGHEEASGNKYVPEEIIEAWVEKDPIINFEAYLKSKEIINNHEIDKIKTEIKDNIEKSLDLVAQEGDIPFDESINQVFKPDLSTVVKANSETETLRFIDSIREGLWQSMEKHPDLVLMGQDISDYGGVFKVTEGFLEEFGADRVRNTPLCESAIIGAALGLSILDKKSMVEMQFADFVTCGFNQIVNNLAKSFWRWGQNADVVIRMPTGAGSGGGPFHSQSNEAWFFHVPGLKIVYPSNPEDAKGLLCAALNDPNPVLFFEHKVLYRSLKSEVPTDYYTQEIGKGNLLKDGTDAVIITYGMGVHWALEVVKEYGDKVAILDLKTLLPLDESLIYQAVKKVGKALVLHEDNLTGGIGAEISSLIHTNCFEHLDAPVKRVGSMDIPIPFAKQLEKEFLASSKLKKELDDLLNY
jgi:2-oxoisovalerate dehydrogenase E1 component